MKMIIYKIRLTNKSKIQKNKISKLKKIKMKTKLTL